MNLKLKSYHTIQTKFEKITQRTQPTPLLIQTILEMKRPNKDPTDLQINLVAPLIQPTRPYKEIGSKCPTLPHLMGEWVWKAPC